MTVWQRAITGDTKGRPMPHDARIKALRASGLGYKRIAREVGLTRSAVQWRLWRIAAQDAAREES